MADLLSPADVAGLLDVSEETVRKAFRAYDADRTAGVPADERRGLPCVRVGDRLFRADRDAVLRAVGGYLPDVDPQVVQATVDRVTRDEVARQLAPVVERLVAAQIGKLKEAG